MVTKIQEICSVWRACPPLSSVPGIGVYLEEIQSHNCNTVALTRPGGPDLYSQVFAGGYCLKKASNDEMVWLSKSARSDAFKCNYCIDIDTHHAFSSIVTQVRNQNPKSFNAILTSIKFLLRVLATLQSLTEKNEYMEIPTAVDEHLSRKLSFYMPGLRIRKCSELSNYKSCKLLVAFLPPPLMLMIVLSLMFLYTPKQDQNVNCSKKSSS